MWILDRHILQRSWSGTSGRQLAQLAKTFSGCSLKSSSLGLEGVIWKRMELVACGCPIWSRPRCACCQATLCNVHPAAFPRQLGTTPMCSPLCPQNVALWIAASYMPGRDEPVLGNRSSRPAESVTGYCTADMN